ncbi:MAG: glycine cleavage system protein T [Chloroflexota bacterium]|nr:glycine cleavage system protein T [Chloroflexota bacterium]
MTLDSLSSVQRAHGAVLANDGIPLHFGDMAAEYHAALNAVVLMDRSHEGRIRLDGRDRLAIPHRTSTNDCESLTLGAGCATIFTNPNARILDRALLYHRGETALMLTEPGRGIALMGYVQRNIFFNDDLRLHDLSSETRAFALHGPQADALMATFDAAVAALPALHSAEIDIAGARVTACRIKPISSAAWVLIVPNDAAAAVWEALRTAAQPLGGRAAGSLVYNALRIWSGRPGVGRELSSEYIPLEVGLWDEVSFKKGCYTGQEIIARMESRGKLARTITRVALSAPVDAPAELSADGKQAGTLTSAVVTPNGDALGIAVLRMAYAEPGVVLKAGGADVHVVDFAAAQPPR